MHSGSPERIYLEKGEYAMNLEFEPLSIKHAGRVMDIFNYYIENSFAAYPDAKLPGEFFNMFLESAKQYPAYVMKPESEDRIIGFCLLRAYNPFPSFRETAEISYFIDPECVGRGLGKKALDLLEEDAKKRGVKTLLAEISSENAASLSFHRKNGFAECGRMKEIGVKFGKHFDVVWMQKTI